MIAPVDETTFDLTQPADVEMVRQLFFSTSGPYCWATRCVSAGLDPDDVLQEVYRSLHARCTRGTGFDPARGAPGKSLAARRRSWVGAVIGSVVSNQVAAWANTSGAGRGRRDVWALGAVHDEALTARPADIVLHPALDEAGEPVDERLQIGDPIPPARPQAGRVRRRPRELLLYVGQDIDELDPDADERRRLRVEGHERRVRRRVLGICDREPEQRGLFAA